MGRLLPAAQLPCGNTTRAPLFSLFGRTSPCPNPFGPDCSVTRSSERTPPTRLANSLFFNKVYSPFPACPPSLTPGIVACSVSPDVFSFLCPPDALSTCCFSVPMITSSSRCQFFRVLMHASPNCVFCPRAGL